MNDKMHKTSICSIVALDIIDYSKKAVAEQVEIKSQLDHLINLAVIDIPQADRVVIDNGQGAVITCSGPLEDALEDALFISITIRDEILKNNIQSLKPWYVQFGINLGSVRVGHNIKGEPDMIGEGVDEAKRIMSFANPNQILVSRVYYEMASKLTQEIAKMFEQYDMHAHEEEVYAVRVLKDQAAVNGTVAASMEDSAPVKWQSIAGKINWMYVGIGLLLLAAFFLLAKQLIAPTEPIIVMDPPVVAEPVKKPGTTLSDAPKPVAEPVEAAESNQIVEPAKPSEATAQSAKVSEPDNKVQNEPKKTKVAQKKVPQQSAVEAKSSESNKEKSVPVTTEKPIANTSESHPSATATAKPAESKTEKNTIHEKSGWQTFKDSVKNGSERKCTQAEIAMNQCAK